MQGCYVSVPWQCMRQRPGATRYCPAASMHLHHNSRANTLAPVPKHVVAGKLHRGRAKKCTVRWGMRRQGGVMRSAGDFCLRGSSRTHGRPTAGLTHPWAEGEQRCPRGWQQQGQQVVSAGQQGAGWRGKAAAKLAQQALVGCKSGSLRSGQASPPWQLLARMACIEASGNVRSIEPELRVQHTQQACC